MAAVSVTLTKINKLGNGKILISFGKRTREFNDGAHLQAFLRDTLTPDVLEAIFLRLAIDRQPTLANPSLLEGHTLTVDTSLASWGTVS